MQLFKEKRKQFLENIENCKLRLLQPMQTSSLTCKGIDGAMPAKPI
jgi:hypothetical protein